MAKLKCEQQHRVYKNDPIELRNYLHKQVEVKVLNGKVFSGWVKTIDPVSESVVLINFNKDTPSTIQIILGNNVESIKIVSSDELYKNQLISLFHEKEESFSEEELRCRKERLKLWLHKNRLPVSEKNDILDIAGAVKILPPYGSKQCISANEIILGKIQGLISSIPKNVEELE